jgi:twinkle protein
MATAERGASFLDQSARKHMAVIHGDQIDWQKYLRPEDKSRVVPAEALTDRGKARIALGAEQESGLTLPWEKADGKVLMRPGKLMIWAGWTHHGKSQMVKQLMLHAIKSSEKPLIASMEEDITDVWCDMATIACGDKPALASVNKFVDYTRGNLWFYDQQGQLSPQKIQAVIRYAAAELKVTQVVIDSLMMMALDKDDYNAQARFVGELKATAKDTGVTVHLVVHMRKRDGKGGDESPGTVHDIAGGHEIASEADSVFVVWRDKKPMAQPACLLKVEKQRGRVNWLGTFALNYHSGHRQFVEDVHPMKFWSDEPVHF